MKFFALIACVGALSAAHSQFEVIQFSKVNLKSDTLDTSLGENESRYTFQFTGLDGTKNRMVYAIDGKESTEKLANNSLTITTTPGKHVFQFYYSENFFETYSDSLEIKRQHHSVYSVLMENAVIMVRPAKPVIYLYPTEELEVSVNLAIKGTPTFLYPPYEDGWKCRVKPSGELIFGENTYNYLFWESEQHCTFSNKQFQSGFNVKGKDVVAFLEEKLTQAGLNSKEQADFITYWGPKLCSNELNFVRFEFNEECDRYAEITIDPKPKQVYRIYMSWTPIAMELDLVPQRIEPFNREGFSVLEWGGMELDPSAFLNLSRVENKESF